MRTTGLGMVKTISRWIALLLLSATASCYKSIGFGDEEQDGSVTITPDDTAPPGAAPTETEHEDFDTQTDYIDPEATDSIDTETVDTQAVETETETATETETDPPVAIPGGVDILLVVDNSQSMVEEQLLLSTAIFTLINELLTPLDGRGGVESVRVGTTTSDIGMQYGYRGETDLSPAVPGCDTNGDDGQLKALLPTGNSITIESGVIPCRNAEDHCPEGYRCDDGVCMAPNDQTTIRCPAARTDPFLETTAVAPDTTLATAAACLVKQGTDGCGIEQQLSAATKALSDNPGFLVESHHLQVIVLTDEDDCSVKDPDLFQTPEWRYDTGTRSLMNVACAYPPENDAYLFSPEEIRKLLLRTKGYDESAVFFTAIAGVPNDTACEGDGTTVSECLDHPDMIPELIEPLVGSKFVLFAPACVRTANDVTITSAVPGWRFVRMAEAFQENGSIYSICRSDWAPIMEAVAGRIWNGIQSRNR